MVTDVIFIIFGLIQEKVSLKLGGGSGAGAALHRSQRKNWHSKAE
jgi:hypothetical protein